MFLHLAEMNANVDRWTIKHLIGMVQLARREDPSLLEDEALVPDRLYGVLSRILPLEEHAVGSITELLIVLEHLDPKYRRAPAAFQSESDRSAYRAMLSAALIEASRQTFTSKPVR